MDKGSKPAGSTTVTQDNTPWNADYLAHSFANARNLFDLNQLSYYPGQTRAEQSPYLSQGYNDIVNTGMSIDQTLRPAGNGVFFNAANGGMAVGNSPAYAGLMDVAGHQMDPRATQQLRDVGASGYGNSADYRDRINSLAGQAPGVTAGSANYLGAMAPQATAFGTSAANQLNDAALGAQRVAAPFAGMLGRNAMAAGANPAMRPLAETAFGGFLNANPFLDDTFGAASDAVTRAYQTTTAPNADSAFEAAGRYGSGAWGNRVGQNEKNLGSTLGNLATSIYGGDYQNERGLMTQAGNSLGNLYLGGVGAGTQAATAGGNLALGGVDAATRGLASAGNLGLSAFNTGGNLSAQGAATGLAGVNAGISGYGTGAGASTAGLNAATSALQAGGNLDLGNLSQRTGALAALQSGFQGGNTDALRALALMPATLESQFTNPNAMIRAGTGLTGIDQSAIADEMARYYGVQQSPWQTAERYSGLLGNPISGTASTTSPYFQNQTANLLGTAIGGLGLINGASTAFGSGGALSGLFSAEVGSSAALGAGGLEAAAKAAPLAFSDRRLKEDIRRLGELDNGLPIYSFRYIGDPELRVGLMADEVGMVHPEAVIDGPRGFKIVDYAKAVLPR